MLKSIQEYVENRIQQSVDKKLLQEAIDDTMKNIAANYFLLGYDVTAKDFMDILVNCVKIRLKLAPATYNTSSDTLNSIVVLDQGGQAKRITGVTILDYNPTTLFGITTDGKKTWLGKFRTPQEAVEKQREIEKAIEEKISPVGVASVS